jgi:uncharacterized protein (DUF58 family)
MPASWRVGRPMRVHGSIPGVRVEARVELGLEWRRWMVGRTGELDEAAADAGERRGSAPEQCERGGVAWGVGGA